MATRWAVASGNWSNTATWDGGTLPAAGDDVHADGKTVAIDQSISVGSIRSTQRAGGTVGGGFTVASAVTIDLTGSQGTFPGSNSVVLCALNHTTGTVTISGALLGGAISNAHAFSLNSTGAVSMIGTFGPQSSNTSAGAVLTIAVGASGNVTMTGPIVGASTSGQNTINSLSANSNISVTGDVTGGAGGMAISSPAATTVVGNIAAGGVTAITVSGSGSVLCTGTITASASAAGVTVSAVTGSVTATGPFISTANRPAVAALGPFKLSTVTTTTYWEFATGDGQTRRLYTADNVGGNPTVGNVRQGTVYGPANELTGTLAVPSPSNVASGVPTDNTVGTATLSAADVAAVVWAVNGRGAKLDGLGNGPLISG